MCYWKSYMFYNPERLGAPKKMSSNIFTINFGNGKTYFFLKKPAETIFWRYDYVHDEADSGFPQTVNDRTWPGLVDPHRITTGLYWDERTVYFLYENGDVLLFDVEKHRTVRGYPRPMTHWREAKNWPSEIMERAGSISTAINWHNNVIYYFLTDPVDTFIRQYRDTDQLSAPRPVKLGFPGLAFDLPAKSRTPMASFRWDNDKAYFFHTGTNAGKYAGGQYFRYDIWNDSVEKNYPKAIFGGWPPIDLSKDGTQA